MLVNKPKQDNCLVGQIEEISMMYLRFNTGAIFMQVQLGKVFVLVHGKSKKPVAILSRPPGENLSMHFDADGKLSYGLAK